MVNMVSIGLRRNKFLQPGCAMWIMYAKPINVFYVNNVLCMRPHRACALPANSTDNMIVFTK